MTFPILIMDLSSLNAQDATSFGIEDDDFYTGGDIFNDYNEDFDTNKVLEDERFYRNARFFSFNTGIGLTSFDGNRGRAYENDFPTYHLGINYFLDFNTSFAMGLEYSKHHFFLEKGVYGYKHPNPDEGYGMVSVNMLRTFFAYRHYIDTANLGTAITYSNPFLTARLEYWYVRNRFIDQDRSMVPDDSGGAIGFALGGGLEFPIKLNESYFGLEFLVHSVNFHDKHTQDYAPIENQTFGYDDMTGLGYSTVLTYNITW